ncbi:hypothetical protein [Shewanella seohaensis]|uniref:hypothetical protein n=1 Tax=Shewanella seohaensis TaxID=755175 RepID=UPI0035B7ED72
MKPVVSNDAEKSFNWPKLFHELLIEKSGVHFFYVLVILLGLIVYLFTSHFAENSQVVAYISFAATISSLILAVFAIFYAVHSNGEISKFSSELRSTSSILEDSSNQIGKTSNELSDITGEINQAIQSLSSKIDDVPRTITEKLDRFQTELKGLSSQNYQVADKKDIIIQDDAREKFIASLAISPKTYSLLIVLAWKAGGSLNKSNFEPFFSEHYTALLSFSSLMNSLGVFKTSIVVGEEDFSVTPTFIDDFYVNLIFDEIENMFRKFVGSDNQQFPKRGFLKCFKIFDTDIPERCKLLKEAKLANQ